MGGPSVGPPVIARHPRSQVVLCQWCLGESRTPHPEVVPARGDLSVILDTVYFCYLDESGGCEPPGQSPNATPVMVILGVIIPAEKIPSLTRDFLAMKRHFFPGRFRHGPALDHVLTEVKGSDLLQMTRSASRDRRRQAKLVRYSLLRMMRGYGCRIVGRVWTKEKGKFLKPDATYCYAVQDISRHYGKYLLDVESQGVLIADGRNQRLNVNVAHSIFT